jgi:phosphinothricin acetyltransferase
MTTIRPATADDLPAVNAITNWAIAHTHAHFATEPEPLEDTAGAFEAAADRHPWLVAEADGAVVAFARAKPWNPRGAYAHSVEISAYVLPDHHARGIGRALYDRLLDDLRARGFRQAVAGIALPNDASVRLHESIGMHHVGTFERIGVKHGVERDVGYWQMAL